MVCLFDRDCPQSLACFTNTTWYATLQPGGDGCMCTTWYGFSGPSCMQADTPTAKFWLATSIINVVTCFLFAGLTLRNAWRLYRSARVALLEATSAANIQVFLAFLLTGVSQILAAIESQNPSMVTGTLTPTSEKIATTKVGREVIFVLGVCSVIVAAMTIALVWLEVAERARKMAHRAVQTMIPRTRRGVIAFEVILVIAMTAACAASAPNIAVVIGIVAIVVVTAIYVVGFCKIYSELKSVSSIAAENNKIMYRSVIMEIERTAAGTILCALVLLVLCIIILVLSLSDWKESSPPGIIPPIIISWQVLYFAVIGLAMNLLYALSKATTRKIANNKTSDNSGSGVLPALDKPTGRKTDLETGLTTLPNSPTVASSAVAAYQVDDRI